MFADPRPRVILPLKTSEKLVRGATENLSNYVALDVWQRNYRGTQGIITALGGVIANAAQPKSRYLWFHCQATISVLVGLSSLFPGMVSVTSFPGVIAGVASSRGS